MSEKMADYSASQNQNQDKAAAAAFLEALSGKENSVFTFQTFDDDHDREALRRASKTAENPFARVRNGTLDQCWPGMSMLNQNGGGVFVTVNETDGNGRKLSNIKNIRAIWVDQDTPGPKRLDWPLPPHIVVESSPMRYHYYWLVETLDFAQFAAVNRRLVRLYGADQAAVDPTRVLRLPGTWHAKKDSRKGLSGTRHLVTAEIEDRPRYEAAEILASFGGDWEEAKAPEEKPQKVARADINIPSLRSALWSIQPESRDVWLRVGMALHGAGFSGARGLWDEWSEQSRKYDPADQQRVWESFKRTEGAVVTVASIYDDAKKAGWKQSGEGEPTQPPKNWRELLLYSDRNVLLDCPANVLTILTHHPRWADCLKYNTLEANVEKTSDCPLGQGAWTDADDMELLRWLALDMRLPSRLTAQMPAIVEAIARKRAYNPFADYLHGLPAWDGSPWLQTCFSAAYGLKTNDYIEALGYCLFGSIVWRTLAPGSPAPQSVVIRGDEQTGKSRFTRIVGGRWHKTILMSMEGKDIYSALQGCVVGELADLDTLGRTGERRIKAFLTALTDTWRPPYARREIKADRSVTFIGTANPDAPLPDGEAQRWLPIDTGANRLRPEALENGRDQMFAQAMALQSKGERPWLPAYLRATADIARGEAQSHDPWETIIFSFLLGRASTTTSEILGEPCLAVPSIHQTRGAATRIGLIMAKNKAWEKKRIMRDGVQEWVYVRKQ